MPDRNTMIVILCVILVVVLLAACNPLCWKDEYGRQQCAFERMGQVGWAQVEP